jgi:septal ring factor EnvC (AmiA/AmiB activator)
MRFKIFDRLIKHYEIDEDTISLQERIEQLEEKYQALLVDVKRLEEENVETTNTLYEIMHSIDAVDARIDIVAENPWKEQFDNV